MKKLAEIGSCPNCDCSISIFKTQNYKRFAKCEVCGTSYALPKRGTISNSALLCPRSNLPLLVVDRRDHKAYFWTDQPCFNCVQFDRCEMVKDLISEFKELNIYGF
jgi:primosomal protein N'